MSFIERCSRWRPRLRSHTLAALAAALVVLACNGRFWAAMLDGRALDAPRTWWWMAALALALWALHFVLFNLLFNRFTARPLAALLIVATAFAVYYMQRFNVYLDTSMLRNVLRTDLHEARELFTLGLLPHLLLYAGLPLLLLWRVRIVRGPWLRSLVVKLLGTLAGVALLVGAVLAVFQDFSSAMRNQREARFLITPANYLYSLARVGLEEGAASAQPRQAIGLDAARLAAATARQRPLLLVLVVGETARAANWGLNGAARMTTPQLAAMNDVISFTDVTSCGTNTEVSLPCMFAPLGRRNYDEARIRGSESLLHVLARAGVAVHWRDNQSGCKGVCEGLSQETVTQAKLPGLCDGERCLDEALLHDFKALVQPRKDQLIVLHQLGNHGPAYYRRYPPTFKRFTPTCDTPDLSRCSREEIGNAYDNALLYTDHVLAQTIAQLRDHTPSHDTALVYASDHGESLGENGLYLHGLPYAIAPREQTRVPMLLWLSPGFAQALRINPACVRERAAAPAAHDHLFHTVLALLQVGTGLYDPTFDLLHACRP